MSSKKYKVESHIPIPERSNGRPPREGTSEFIETALRLEIGQCITFEGIGKDNLERQRNNALCSLRQAVLKRNIARRHCTRSMIGPDGKYILRLWRIE